ncbi:MAG: hypothetical protein II132_04380 [Desulfovibrio sp.]|nr:hypothetical protein [Desulfovibrio sp.]MBQ2516668.1 hypothetical protein [Desulfovibrio sp.]MCR5170484.1 hypothetical protein [Desulfovibrio sp.]
MSAKSVLFAGFPQLPDAAGVAGRRRMLVLLRRLAKSLPEDMSDEEKASMTAELARRLEQEMNGPARGRKDRD